MARPRIFVSSTYYDLKHIRSSLDNFIDSLGFDSVLSEKGNIAYSPDIPLDESCYREALSADMLVLIIGGRYGSEASSEEATPTREFFERYDSITKKEYDSACSRDIPVYILIESNVQSEYQTYLRNKKNAKIQYAHVDSVNIFQLIEDILGKPRNNPVHTFERFSDIESWLREQWSGLFRELLQRMSSSQQMSALSTQVDALGAINETLQTYLEAVVTKLSPDDAPELIESERKRLEEIELLDRLRRNKFFQGVFDKEDVDIKLFKEALLEADTFADFSKKIGELTNDPGWKDKVWKFHNIPAVIEDLNGGRDILGRKVFPLLEKTT